MERFGIGQPAPREEDPYLLRGAGRYVDDVRLLDMCRAVVLRSPHAHARIRSIDIAAAKAAPGVLLVLTGESPEVTALGLQVPRMPRKRRDGSPGFNAPQPHLARGIVRYVGDPVALVVAETLNQAKDAAELIAIDYEQLPALVSTAAAAEPGAIKIWDSCPDNVAFYHEVGNKAAVEAAFAKADRIVKKRLVINRITANSMEPRGALSQYDTREGRYIIRCTLQAPHRSKSVFAQLLKVPETQVRVICENVGGGFGMKGSLGSEYVLTALASRLLERPVKWVADRSEGLLSDEQARDNVTEAQLALDKDGTFLALRTRTLANIGAYHTSDRAAGPPVGNLGSLAGTYTTPALYCEVLGVLTHTQLTGHYRGAGRPEASYIVETMIDLAAREMGIDAAEIRRRNTIPEILAPYKTGLTFVLDSGNFGKNLGDALKLVDYPGFAARRAESQKRGKLRGIGVTNTIEGTAGGMLEHAEVRFDFTGTLTLLMGTHDHGQGHATTFKQILCERLGIGPDKVRFRNGDTDEISTGTGTFGSRSTACGGAAIAIAADKVIARGKKIASHLMEAAEADIVFDAGKYSVAGTDRSITLLDVAKASYMPGRLPRGSEMGLYETGTYDGGAPTFPNGSHICEVEIDAATGAIELVRYVAVDDCGRVINPLLLEGQMHGGIAQGVGQALMEDLTIDPGSGQVMAGSFMDYAMPRATDFCDIEMETNEVPAKTNPLGVKGGGEAGTVGGLAAAMNAINDALMSAGAPYVEMPCTAEKVWRALQSARKAAE